MIGLLCIDSESLGVPSGADQPLGRNPEAGM
jgi:hypothetical protein